MKALVTGAAGYIGSHLVDYLVEKGADVVGVDNFASGKKSNIQSKLRVREVDIRNFDITYDGYESPHDGINEVVSQNHPDVIFHLAAVSRTPWAIEDPIYTYETNVVGSANVLEAARRTGVKKVVLASSNIVYAAQTPYRSSKLAMEMVARDYNDLYDLPTVCLRFSNVYGGVEGQPLRQHEDNVLAALAKSKRETGRLTITGDGEQTRNFTHVLDICEALWLAARPVTRLMNLKYHRHGALTGPYTGSVVSDHREGVRGTELDIMNPTLWSLNEVAKFYDCPVDYVADRKGDIKHLQMGIGPEKAKELLGFEAKRELTEYIKPYVN